MAHTPPSSVETINEVRLVGTLSQEPLSRVLPSGDEVVTVRVVVPRPEGRSDALDCAIWTAAGRRKAKAWHRGDVVDIQGSLRRRFWRSPSGAASRWEVEVDQLRRLSRGT